MRKLFACAFLLLPSLAWAQAAPYPITVCCLGSSWSEGFPSSTSVNGASVTASGISLGGGSSLTLAGNGSVINGSGSGAGINLTGSNSAIILSGSNSSIALNTNKFTVAGSTGNTLIAGTLAVTGASTLTGAIFTANGIAGINVGSSGYTGRGTTNPTNAINIYDGTAPVGASGSGFITLYSTAGELRVMDSGGVATLLSPHDHATGKWIYDSIESSTGRRITIQMEDLAKWLDAHYGTTFVKETAPPSPYPVVKR